MLHPELNHPLVRDRRDEVSSLEKVGHEVGISRERNPTLHRTRSLDLVGSLWRHETAETRPGEDLPRRVSNSRAQRVVVEQSLIHTFPVELIPHQ